MAKKKKDSWRDLVGGSVTSRSDGSVYRIINDHATEEKLLLENVHTGRKHWVSFLNLVPNYKPGMTQARSASSYPSPREKSLRARKDYERKKGGKLASKRARVTGTGSKPWPWEKGLNKDAPLHLRDDDDVFDLVDARQMTLRELQKEGGHARVDAVRLKRRAETIEGFGVDLKNAMSYDLLNDYDDSRNDASDFLVEAERKGYRVYSSEKAGEGLEYGYLVMSKRPLKGHKEIKSLSDLR